MISGAQSSHPSITTSSIWRRIRADIARIIRVESSIPGRRTFNRITQQPDRMGGKPCIRGMRVTVGMVVGQIGPGRTIEELLTDYPYLERDDILQALKYASWLAEEREIELARA